MSLLRKNALRATVTAFALLMSVQFAEAQTKVKTGFNMFSPEQDVEIGRQSAAQAEQQLPILRDSRTEAFVDSLGERLAAAAPGPKFDYHFGVVNASDLNAFAL